MLTLLLCLFSVTRTDGRIFTQHVESFAPWRYLTRFCFEPQSSDSSGNTLVKVSFRNTSGTNLRLLAYYEKEGFEESVSSLKTCASLVDAAGVNNVALADPSLDAPDAFIQENAERGLEGMVHSAFRINFGGSRPRWYYFAISNCASDVSCVGDGCAQGGLSAWVHLEMTNGGSEFSADEVGLLPTNAIFVFLYTILSGFAIALRVVAKRRKVLNPTINAFVLTIMMSWFSVLLEMCHFSVLDKDGLGLPRLHDGASVVRILADCLYVLVCVLFAKGWNVCRRALSTRSRVRLAVYLSFYLCLSLGSDVWATWGVSPMQVVYKYESVPGGLLVGLRVVAFVWMAWATHTTTQNFYMMAKTFNRFLLLASVWILSLPAIFLLALALDSWRRARVVYIIDLILLFSTQASILFQWWPNLDNGRFPFKRLLRFNSSKTLPSKFNDLPDRDEIEQVRDIAAMVNSHTQEMLRLLGQTPVLSIAQVKAQQRLRENECGEERPSIVRQREDHAADREVQYLIKNNSKTSEVSWLLPAQPLLLQGQQLAASGFPVHSIAKSAHQNQKSVSEETSNKERSKLSTAKQPLSAKTKTSKTQRSLPVDSKRQQNVELKEPDSPSDDMRPLVLTPTPTKSTTKLLPLPQPSSEGRPPPGMRPIHTSGGRKLLYKAATSPR